MFSLKKWFLALMVVFFSGAAIAAPEKNTTINARNHFFKLNIFNLYPYRHHHQHYHIKIG